MPYAEISMPKNFITGEEKSTLAKVVTRILIETEGLIDNPMSRSIALLDIKEFDNPYIGGKSGGQNGNPDKVVSKIYAFSNALSEEAKKKLISEITAAFIAVSDKTQSQNGRNIWCIIFPLNELEFGVGGAPVTLEMIRQLVSAYKE
jgi:phenylpyruvate tautomerase PptA (4-oxalocrotonate tautomerase family)